MVLMVVGRFEADFSASSLSIGRRRGERLAPLPDTGLPLPETVFISACLTSEWKRSFGPDMVRLSWEQPILCLYLVHSYYIREPKSPGGCGERVESRENKGETELGRGIDCRCCFAGSTKRRTRIGFAVKQRRAAGFLGLSENLRVPINHLASLVLSTVAGREIENASHHLEEYLAAYLDGAGLHGDPQGAAVPHDRPRHRQAHAHVLPQANSYAMIGRRAAADGISTKLGNQSFRATGITAYLKNGGTLEKSAAMANHASTRTTQLYDRRHEELTLDEVERIGI
jgi:hypothetical protein